MPDKSFTIICAQELFDSTLCKEADGSFKQWYNNLPEVKEDLKEAKRAAGFIKADDFGENNELILNPALETANVSFKQLSELQKILRNRLTKEVDSLHLCMQFFAGHGMQRDGLQVIVVNEFDPYGKFYKLYRAEQRIRYSSETFNNCYFIGIFACCREIFKALKHANCISKEENERKIQEDKAE